MPYAYITQKKKKEVSPPNIETVPSNFPFSPSSFFLSQKITLSRYLFQRVIRSSINRDKRMVCLVTGTEAWRLPVGSGVPPSSVTTRVPSESPPVVGRVSARVTARRRCYTLFSRPRSSSPRLRRKVATLLSRERGSQSGAKGQCYRSRQQYKAGRGTCMYRAESRSVFAFLVGVSRLARAERFGATWWGQVNSRWWGWNTGQREREADSESRRELDGGEGARGRRKRTAAHNSVRRPAIRFVLDVSNRLARRSRERETVVHVFTFVRQLRLTKYSPGQNGARLARSIFLYFFVLFSPFNRSFPRRIVISSLARPSCLFVRQIRGWQRRYSLGNPQFTRIPYRRVEKPERLVEGYVCLSGGYEGLTSVRESLLNTHGKEEEGTQWFAGVESQQRRARVSLPVNQSAIQSVSRSFSQCRFYTPNVFFSLSVYIQSQVPQWWLSRCVLLATNDNPLSVSETRNGNTKKTDRKLGSYWWCCTIFVFHR